MPIHDPSHAPTGKRKYKHASNVSNATPAGIEGARKFIRLMPPGSAFPVADLPSRRLPIPEIRETRGQKIKPFEPRMTDFFSWRGVWFRRTNRAAVPGRWRANAIVAANRHWLSQ